MRREMLLEELGYDGPSTLNRARRVHRVPKSPHESLFDRGHEDANPVKITCQIAFQELNDKARNELSG